MTEHHHYSGLTFDIVDSSPDGTAAPGGWNEPGKNGTVVLLHGFPQTSRSWNRVGEVLNTNGYRTIAVDQRGYSPGARPHGRRAYRLERLSDDIASLIEKTGTGTVHVVGHDWGAAVSWILASRRPDLVRTLTAVSVPHPAAFALSMLCSTQALRSYYMFLFQFPRIPEWIARRHPRAFDAILRKTGMTQGAIAEFHSSVLDTGALPYAINWYRAMPLSSPKTIAAPVRVPTTYVWSDRDAALGRRGAELTHRYVHGNYRFEVFTGASHWILDEAPEQLAQVVMDRARR